MALLLEMAEPTAAQAQLKMSTTAFAKEKAEYIRVIEAKGAKLGLLQKLGLQRYEAPKVLHLRRKGKKRVDQASSKDAPPSIPQANHA